jgi:plasmid stabilization system protein ParE
LDLFAEYDSSIEYQSGAKNTVADACSRRRGLLEEGSPVTADEAVALVAVVVGQETGPESWLRSADDLEPELLNIADFLQTGVTPEGLSRGERRQITRGSRSFALRAIPPMAMRLTILAFLHDEVGHWDTRTTMDFVTERFWWPGVSQYVGRCVRSCVGCQKVTPVPAYKSTLHQPIGPLFRVFSLDLRDRCPGLGTTTRTSSWASIITLGGPSPPRTRPRPPKKSLTSFAWR